MKGPWQLYSSVLRRSHAQMDLVVQLSCCETDASPVPARHDAKGRENPGPRTRELQVSAAGDTGFYASTHGTSAHAVPPVPPQGHFKVNRHGHHSFHHDASTAWQDGEVPENKQIYRGVERVARPAEPPAPGQIVVRATLSGVSLHVFHTHDRTQN